MNTIFFALAADFGYVKDRRRELTEYCNLTSSNRHRQSSLRCSKVI